LGAPDKNQALAGVETDDRQMRDPPNCGIFEKPQPVMVQVPQEELDRMRKQIEDMEARKRQQQQLHDLWMHESERLVTMQLQQRILHRQLLEAQAKAAASYKGKRQSDGSFS